MKVVQVISPGYIVEIQQARERLAAAGGGTLDVGGERLDLHEGQAAFVRAGAEHRFVGYEQLSVLVIFEKEAR